MGLEGPRIGGASREVTRRPSEEPALEIPATVTGDRGTPIPDTSDVGTTTVVPGLLPTLTVGHPLLCRDVSSEAPTTSLDDFRALFGCRLAEIREDIRAGRLDEAARGTRELNVSWRSFLRSHRDLPRRDRNALNALLGNLYFVQATLERARGIHRDAYAVHFEARGHDLTGDSYRARIGYREFMRMTEGTEDPYLSEYREFILERRPVLELEAVGRITREMRGVISERDDFSAPEQRRDLDFFMGRVRELIECGRAAGLDEAIEILRADHRLAVREVSTRGVPAGSVVTATTAMSEIRLSGGELEIPTRGTECLHVVIGPEGGLIRTAGGHYFFPPTRDGHEVHVEFIGRIRQRCYAITSHGERLLERGTEWYGPGESVPGWVTRRFSGTVRPRVYELDERGRPVGPIHPNTFDSFFNPDGTSNSDWGFWTVVNGETLPAEEPDYLFDFNRRLRAIGGSITSERLEDAGRLIDEANVWWRAFNAANPDIPRADRDQLLGRLYLLQASLEEARGEERRPWQLHYGALGHDLCGDGAGALLNHREFLVLTEGLGGAELARMRDVSREAVARLSMEQIRARLENVFAWRGEIMHLNGERLSAERADYFLDRIQGYLDRDEAETIDEAIEIMAESYRQSLSIAPSVLSGHVLNADEDMSAAHLRGGVLELFRLPTTNTLHVIVGREGGLIRSPAGGYTYFPPSDREVHVLFRGSIRGRCYVETEEGERLLERGREWFGSGDSGAPTGDINRLLSITERDRRPGLDLEPFFDREGNLDTDEVFTALLRMEGDEHGARLGDPAERDRCLLEQARAIGVREGSFTVANQLVMQVFDDHFDRALQEIQSDTALMREIAAEVADETDTDEEYEAEFAEAVLERASARMTEWVSSGALAREDAEAAEAWELFNEWADPNGEVFNITAENGHLAVDEAIIMGVTLPAALVTGGAAGEAVVATRVARLASVGLRLWTRSLLLRFGPRMMARGLLVSRVAARTAFVGTTRTLVETPIMVSGGAALRGRELTPEQALDEMGHTGRTLGVFHLVGGSFSGVAGLFFRSRVGLGITEWAEGSAARGLVVRGGVGIANLGTMTTVATEINAPSEEPTRDPSTVTLTDLSEASWGERFLAEGARMLFMSLVGGATERLTGHGSSSRSSRSVLEGLRTPRRPASRPSGPSLGSRVADFARGVALAPMWLALGNGGGGFGPIRFGRGRVIPATYRTSFEAGGRVVRARVGERTSYLLREADGTHRAVGREAYDAYRNWLAGRYERLSREHAAVATGERGIRGLMEAFAGEGYERTPAVDFLLRSEQLRPTSRVTAGGRTFYLSPVIRTVAADGPRTYCLGFTPVLEGGRVRLREVLFYRSNSDAPWRAAAYRLGDHLAKTRFRGPDDRAPTHYTQETQIAPEILEHLEGLESHDGIEMSEGALGMIVNVEADINRGRAESMLGHFGRQARISLTPGLRPVQEYRPGRLDLWADGAMPMDVVGDGLPTMEIFRNGLGMRVDALRELTYPDGFIPDFSSPIREYTGRQTLLGETTYREYTATLNGEPVIWTVAEAAGDRVWIQGIRYQDVLVTDFGTYDRVIDSGILTSKPLEYTSQLGNLPAEYRRPVERTDGGPAHYEDITPLLRELEPIRRYREAREPTVVEPVAARRVIQVEEAPVESPPVPPAEGEPSGSDVRPTVPPPGRAGGGRIDPPTERAPSPRGYIDLARGLRMVIDRAMSSGLAQYLQLMRSAGTPVERTSGIVTRRLAPDETLFISVPDALARRTIADRLGRQEGATLDEMGEGRFRLTTNEGASVEIAFEMTGP